MKEAYPLCWPAGYKRNQYRVNSRFKSNMENAQRFLRLEIMRLNGSDLIVSTNLPVRQDGGLYADYMKRRIDDPGVAIYFRYKKKDISMCADQYLTVWENIYALAKGVEALRGMERWGVSDFLDRVFTGFAALPAAHTYQPWFSVLGVNKDADEESIKETYRQLAKLHHPDKGGDAGKFNQIQTAYEEGLQQLKR